MSANSIDFIYDYIREDYEREVARYGRLRDRISFVSGFVLLLGTGMASILGSYRLDLHLHASRDAVFIFSMAGSLSFFVVTLYYLFRCAIPVFFFANVPAADVIWRDYEKWANYANDVRIKDKPEIEPMFKKGLAAVLAKAAASNRSTTEYRSKLLNLSLRSALFSAIILVAPTTCNVLKSYDDPKVEPLKVEIVNPLKSK